jgi:hypothetical protein
VKFYVVDKWRWVRAIVCTVLAALVNAPWYPIECNIPLRIFWLAAVLVVGLPFVLVSRMLVPLRVDVIPRDGPLRLDL